MAESALKHLDQVFGPPFFPAFSRLAARMSHEGFIAGEQLVFGDTISTQPLQILTGGSTGYRFERGGKVFTYCTDVEHLADAPDPDIKRFVDRSDAAALRHDADGR